ncbi:nickel/cobalt efflux transporter [Methylobacterium radiotolerans]|jgi:nickel/cobalt exporter|uniref:nickel/cobalt efflux transporter n=1 Tax=Methylobacterium radiotolerans TaxID=31998 RepID=UPI0038D25772
MMSLTDLLQQSTAHAWLFIPSAILLGALHGLEPGHSKTMMAAFIIAVRGTVGQAVLLGLSAAISHTAVVWVVALGGQYLGRNLNAEATEPYFQIASAVIILGVAAWMIWRTWRDQELEKAGHHHDHGHDHHHHGEEVRKIDTGHGIMALEVFEDGVPPRFRVRFESGHGWAAKDVTVTTERPHGVRQAFTFADRGGYLESFEEIPEPHAFMARVSLGHGNHSHDYDVPFLEHGDNDDTLHAEAHGLNVVQGGEYMDAHERAHADDIARRFSGRSVTTGQIVLFGLTGGLIPCPAAITVLLLCLQIKQLTLGAALVLCFSIGLAVTMVSAGVIASLSVRHIQKRWFGFSAFARRAPYASGVLMVLIALYMGASGWRGLETVHAASIASHIAQA